MKMSKSICRGSTFFLAAALAAAMGAGGAQAANLSWDSDANGANGAGGGTGSWNNSLSGTPLNNWYPGTGAADQAWVNANLDTAVFGGTAATVTLTDNVTVGGIRFNTNNYVINGNTNSRTLTFGAGTNSIALGSGVSATITSQLGGTGDINLFRFGTAGVNLNLNGASTGGWSGSTTIGTGVTLALSGTNQGLLNTSGITLNGGAITLTNTSAQAALDRVSNTAGITSNGGTITYANTATASTAYAETIGPVALTTGALNVALSNNQSSATNSQTLTLAGLTHTGATNTSSVAFSASTTGPNATTNQIKVTGAGATTAGQIIGPWATVGTAAANQTDYAVYNGSGNIVAANIAATGQSAWSASTDSYTVSGGGTLTGTRTIAALRGTGAAQTLDLGAFNLETNGILNGGSGTLTVNGSGVIRQNGTSAAAVFMNAGNAGITINPAIVDNTGALTLVKTGGGTLTLNGINTYTGGTNVDAGTLTLGGITTTALNATLNNGSVVVTVPSVTGLVVGQGVSGSNIPSGTVITAINPTTLTVTLSKAATGTGANITLSFIDSNRLATTGSLNVSGALNLGGSTQTLGSGTAATINGGTLSNGTIVKSGSNYQATQGTISASLTGSVGLDKTSSGTLTLSNTVSNTFTGTTTISEGNVVAGVNGQGTIAISGDLIVGSRFGGNAASYSTQTNAVAWSSSKNLTVYSNGSVAFGGGAQNLQGTINIIGGSIDGSQIYTQNATYNLTGGTLTGTFFANGATYNILASSSTSRIGIGTNAGSQTFNVADGSAATDLAYTGSLGVNGALNLTKNGAGMMVASGTSTYTGITTINGGTLSVSSLGNGGVSGNIGSASNAATQLVLNGGVLQYTGAGTSTDRNFTVGTTAGSGLDASGTGAITFSGSATMSGTNTARTFTLTGTNAGANTLSGVIGNNGSGATSLTKAGAGTWVLSGANTYTGTTTVNGGTLVADTTTNANVLSSSSALALGGGTFQLKGLAATARSQTLNGLTVNAGSSAVDVNNLGTSTTLTLGNITRNAGGTVDFKATTGTFGTDAIVGTTAATANGILGAWATVNGGANLATKNGSNQVVAYTGYTDIDALGSTIVDGTATNVRLNTTTGSGNVILGATTTNINTLMQNTATASTVDTTSGTLRLGTVGGILLTPTAAALTIGTAADAGTLTAGGNANDVAGELILTNNSASTLTINSTVANNGTGAVAVTKSGGGLTVLNGSNTYTGATTINSGTLQAGSTSALGVNSAVTLANGAATLDLNGNNIQVGSLNGGGTFGGSVTLGAATLTTGGGNGTGSYAGVISGSGALTKIGSGTQTLTGANTYTGATTVSSGVLNIQHATATGTTAGGVSVASGAELQIQNNITVGAEALTLYGTGVTNGGALRNISGTNTWQGTVTLGGAARINSDSGTLTFDTAANAITANNQNLTLGGASGGFVVGTITLGTGGLTKDGTGTWGLYGMNTYTGVTTVSGGILGVDVLGNGGTASSLGLVSSAASNLVLNGGLLRYTGVYGSTDRNFTVGTTAGSGLDASGIGAITFTGAPLMSGTNTARTFTLTGSNTDANTMAGVIADNGIGATALTKSGSGKWVLSGANTFTGVTTVSAGTLSVANIGNGGVAGNLGQATSAAANIVINGGTLEYTGVAATTDRSFTIGTSGGTFSSSGTGAFTLSAPIALSGTNAARTFTLGGTNTDDNTVSAVLANNGTGATALTKSGTGKWVLANTNTYTGVTSASGGILSVATIGHGGVAGNLGQATNAASNLVLNGGTLQYTGATASTDRNFTIGTTAGSALDASGTGAITFTGTPTLSGSNTARTFTLTGSSTGANTLTGVIGNNGTGATSILKTGTGTWQLSGVNSFTGGTTISGGTLMISSLANEATTGVVNTFSSGTTSLTLTAAAAAELVAGGITVGSTVTGTGIAGGTTVSAFSGTSLTLSVGTSAATTAASTLTFNAGAATSSSLGAATTNAANLVLSNGATLQYVGAGSSTNRNFTVGLGGGTIDASGTGALNLTNPGAVALSGTNTARTFTLGGTNTGANTLSGILGDNGTGATSLTKSGAGTWALNAVNTYTGDTIISAGTLALGASGAINANSAITVAAGATFDTSAQSYAFNTTKTTTIGVSATAAGLVNVAAVTFSSANLGFDFGSTSTLLASYTVLTVSGIETGDFNQVTATGSSVSGSFLNAGSGNWTLTAGGYDLTFSESLGTLTAVASSVPEPATYAAIFGLLALTGAACRRRRSVRG